MSDFLTKKTAEIARAMKRGKSTKSRARHYDIEPYQTTPHTGGAIMGSNSAGKRGQSYLQTGLSNLFVHGRCRISAKSGLQPDRNDRSADLSGRRRHQKQVPEKSRSVDAGVKGDRPWNAGGRGPHCSDDALLSSGAAWTEELPSARWSADSI